MHKKTKIFTSLNTLAQINSTKWFPCWSSDVRSAGKSCLLQDFSTMQWIVKLSRQCRRFETSVCWLHHLQGEECHDYETYKAKLQNFGCKCSAHYRYLFCFYSTLSATFSTAWFPNKVLTAVYFQTFSMLSGRHDVQNSASVPFYYYVLSKAVWETLQNWINMTP